MNMKTLSNPIKNHRKHQHFLNQILEIKYFLLFFFIIFGNYSFSQVTQDSSRVENKKNETIRDTVSMKNNTPEVSNKISLNDHALPANKTTKNDKGKKTDSPKTKNKNKNVSNKISVNDHGLPSKKTTSKKSEDKNKATVPKQ